MAISTELRRAGPYTGDGAQTEFSFGFKVFEASQVSVVTSSEDGLTDVVVDPSSYSVTLNDNQDTSPGGTIRLTTALAAEKNLSILSAVHYVQPMVLTNRGGFYPEVLNDSADRAVILAQQNREILGRALTVPATSTETPAEMTGRLLEAADTATVVAKGYADAAQRSAEEARAIEQRLTSQEGSLANELAAEGKRQLQAVKAEGQKQSQAVVAEGDAQVARIKTAGDATLNAQGGGCIEVSWTADKSVSAGTPIKLPHGAQFIVGRHHVRLAWNGLVLYGGTYFSEVGEANKFSGEVTLTFDLRQGDEINAWISTLGSADASEAIATAVAAEQAVADLSRNVVYKNEQAAKE